MFRNKLTVTSQSYNVFNVFCLKRNSFIHCCTRDGLYIVNIVLLFCRKVCYCELTNFILFCVITVSSIHENFTNEKFINNRNAKRMQPLCFPMNYQPKTTRNTAEKHYFLFLLKIKRLFRSFCQHPRTTTRTTRTIRCTAIMLIVAQLCECVSQLTVN